MSNRDSTKYDVLVVGGGLIGLSLAWDLALHDTKVCVIDRGELGQEASWAGAGMVPPGAPREHWPAADPLEQLEGLSQTLHRRWHEQLKASTEIDNGYRQRGAIHLAMTEEDLPSLKCETWQRLGVAHHAADARALVDLEPAMAEVADRCRVAYVVPDAAQIRNPWHIRALVAACRQRGVDLRPGVELRRFRSAGDSLTAVETSEGTIEAAQFCLAAGAWSGELASTLGLSLSVRPILGQIVLVKGPPGLLKRHVCVGRRYLVPRDDGRVLIGSTQEDVGFNRRTTAEARDELLSFATSLAPEIARQPVEKCWSGLRPATTDGRPYLGRAPNLQNLWLATGHFRAGLQLSSGTAVVLSALMRGVEAPIDISKLGVDR